MKDKTARNCVKECIKEGEAHDFTGRVKVILEENSEAEERWRILGASFIGIANMMIAANFTIDILFAFSYRENIYHSAHCILCTAGLQFSIPLSVLVLNTMNGPSAHMKKAQRRLEHILLSLLGMLCAIPGSILPLLDPRECMPKIHVYGAYATGGALGISILSGFIAFFKKNEDKCPSIVTTIHRFLGMIAVLGCSITYLTSLGECRATMQFWLYSFGREAPMYMLYFIVILYTLIVLVLPGSRFIKPTKYKDES